MANNLLLYDNGRDFKEENGFVLLAKVGEKMNKETGTYEPILISGRTWTDDSGFTFNFSQDGYYVMKADTPPEGSGIVVPKKGDMLTLVDERPSGASSKYKIYYKVAGYDNVYAGFEIGYEQEEEQGEVLSGIGMFFDLRYYDTSATTGETEPRMLRIGVGINVGFRYFKEKIYTLYRGCLKSDNEQDSFLEFEQSGDTDYYYHEGENFDTWGMVTVKSGTSCYVPSRNCNRSVPQTAGKMYNTSGETRTVNIKNTSAETTNLTAVTMTVFKTLDGTEEAYASAYTPGSHTVCIIKGDPDAGIWVTTNWVHQYNQFGYLKYFDGSLSAHTVSELTEADEIAVTSVVPGVIYETKNEEVFYNPSKPEYDVVWKAPNMFYGSFSPQTHADFDELFPMIDDFFAGNKKINVTLYSWFEPGLPSGADYPDPKACNFMRYGTFTNNGYPVMNGYQFGGGGCETYHISYDKQTRTITFATQNHCI